MPKLILFAALFLRSSHQRISTAAEAHTQMTRSRSAPPAREHTGATNRITI